MILNNLEEFNLDKEFLTKCEEFKKILQHWGKIHNLSAELEDSKIENNIFDSVYVLKFIKLKLDLTYICFDFLKST